MSFFRKGISAVGKLITLGILVVVFFAGMATVVLMSLQGSEIKVPEITGKNFSESERELASLGLKIKKRAVRVSQEPPNTVIEQLPRPGETVKTGQMIYVVTSKVPGEGDEPLPVLKKTTEADDASKIEEMISDKPKKTKSNTNSNKKKADTTRDVIDANSNSNSNSNSTDGNSNSKDHGTENKSTTTNRSTSTPGTRPPGNTSRPNDGRPRLSNRP